MATTEALHRRNVRAFGWLVAMLTPASACIDESALVDCSAPQSAGYETCPCTASGGCMQGLKCLSDTCVDPSTLEPATGASGGNGSGEGGGCAPGTAGCACVDGNCGLGLVCIADVCSSDDETSGDATAGDATAGDDTSGEGGNACVDQHAGTCFANGEANCCDPGDICFGEPSGVNACEPPCARHSDCEFCCGPVELMLGKYCSPNSEFCGGVLCIDGPECGVVFDGVWQSYTGDGICDDGGPGSEDDYCDYGTDCTDCDERVPKEMARVADPEFLRVIGHEYRPREHEVRVLFDQRADLEVASELIRVFDSKRNELELSFRPSTLRAFKGIPAPAENLVVASWPQGTGAHTGDLQLFVAQDAMHADYRSDMPALRKQ